MRFLSLFSGIEAASVAWHPLGWECAAVAEVEPFPCAVLAHHYPQVPNLGDVTKITADQIKALGHIDLVCGGFPCQDLSVAGKRKGLSNADGTSTRSGLFFDAMRIAEWASPRWLFIENVPGMFSSNQGRDFAAVVGEMAGCEFAVPRDGWRNAGVVVGPRGLVEWSVMDAQYHGLAQRRKRVFIVRDSGDWASRPPTFLESYRMRRHPAPSRKTRQVAPTIPARSTGGGGFEGTVAYTTKLHNTAANNAGKIFEERTAALDANSPPPALLTAMQVRRLTARECERLQGFQWRCAPDYPGAWQDSAGCWWSPDYTRIPTWTGWRAMDASETPEQCIAEGIEVKQNKKTGKWRVKDVDGPRYKALGNSWAVPCAAWIGHRINTVSSIRQEAGKVAA